MTVQQLKDARTKLEGDISKLIRQFEDETGASVERVETTEARMSDGRTTVARVEVRVAV